MLSYNPVLPVPFVTFEEYSRITGLKLETIRDYVRKGRIIIQEKRAPKEKPLVNLIAMNEIAAREALAKLG
ncbi:hypothetical protein WOC12_00340 [Vibrio parahaemolyticus]|uniref:hypothetical protein n=1 Tax=Vibrio TaxID=662 RepID=UPI00045F14BC|nr:MULTISPECIES: hypothetical protein [Vibrio]GAK14822.1 transcriptional regulator [Vibrio sp. JCM 19053]ANB97621.1 hypothetical protein FORC14_1020 [Vibrio parahaemolyticus]ANZ09596.1 hypothetical protein VpaChn25_0995 [Vibrio parahaemolyticus]EGQ8054749.1 hypothetical protein [Vibrio alginolyticus]EGQ9177714.1 hypothetical protein [Vibrio alginolyticus]